MHYRYMVCDILWLVTLSLLEYMYYALNFLIHYSRPVLLIIILICLK